MDDCRRITGAASLTEMNETATADFLGTTLTDWYASVAAWDSGSTSGPTTCAACEESMLTRVVRPQEWPHELVHALMNSIGAVISQVARSLDEESASDDWETQFANAIRAEELVSGVLEHSRRDINDVLEQCVGRQLR